MKVQFCKSVDVEGEVEVSVEDITNALDDALIDAAETQGSDIANDRTKRFLVHKFIGDVHKCLRGTTDAMISKCDDDTREMIAKRLREQADRWHSE